MTDTITATSDQLAAKFELHRRQGAVKFQLDVDKRLAVYKKKKLNPNKQVELKRGWLIPYLIAADILSWKRWEHWFCVQSAGGLTNQSIPQITFTANKAVRDHITYCLDLIPNQGSESWMGWGSWTNLTYFYGWVLYGLGSSMQKELPPEPTAGASMRLFQVFDMNTMIAYPYDYFGDLMAECNIGRSAGFYPTPHCIAHMMALMQMEQGSDRKASVLDCACGTGRMLLEGSNYTYHLFGQDNLLPCVQACLINLALYAPWGYMPLKTWDYRPTGWSSDEHRKTWRMTQAMRQILIDYDTATEREGLQGDSTSDTETPLTESLGADSEQQYRFEPIKKRRTKGEPDHVQGLLW